MNTAQHPQLVDVREPYEYAAGHIEGALPIPLAELQSRPTKLDRSAAVIFVCRSGGRSAQACAWANSQGFSQALNLQGGMLAWQESIDPQIVVV
jgi:rhodanese-related sulfurtransferase